MAFTKGVGPASNYENTSSSSIQVTLNSCTAGRHLVVTIHWYHGSGTATVSSVTCTGETAVVHGSANYDPVSGRNAIQIASIANLASGGNKTLTVNFSTSVDYRAVTVSEYAGGDTGNWFDKVADGNGPYGGTLNISTNVTTANANSLIVVAAGSTWSGNSGTPGGNYTEDSDISGAFAGWSYAEYDLDAGAAGSKVANATMFDYDDWIITAAVFNVSGGGGGGGTEIQVGTAELAFTGRIILFEVTQGPQVFSPGAAVLTAEGKLPIAAKGTEAFPVQQDRIYLRGAAPQVLLGVSPVKDSVLTDVRAHHSINLWRSQSQVGSGQVTVGILNDNARFMERVYEKYRILTTYSGVLSGLVKEAATPVARKVRAYRRSDGQIVGETTSNAGTGFYQLSGLLPNTEYYVMAFDDDDPVILNALVLDRVLTIDQVSVPVIAPGHLNLHGHQPSLQFLVPMAYKYWRINQIDLPGDYLQITEIRLFTDAVDVTGSLTKTCSFESDAPPTDFQLMFDNDLSNQATIYEKAHVEDVDFEFRFEFSDKGWLNGVKQAGLLTSTRYMRGFTLQASDDAVTWVTRGSVSDLAYPGNQTLSSLYSIP